MYNAINTGCGFVHNTAWSDEDLKECIKSIDKPIEEEILKEQVQDFIGIVKETTDYHAKQDYGKAKLSLVPRRIIWNIATIREYGNNKYPDGGPDNWKTVEVQRYRDAAYRHFLRYLDDPKGLDSESGLPHLWHLACNIAFLCEMENGFFQEVEDIDIVDKTGSGITIDDRVSITTSETEKTEESQERDCSNCRYREPGANFKKCKTCEEGYTNWESETEEG